MDRKIAKHAPKAISELAERQHGVIATAQLYSLGLFETQIAVRVRNGWLHRVHSWRLLRGQAKLDSKTAIG
jgi:hypothetical protein